MQTLYIFDCLNYILGVLFSYETKGVSDMHEQRILKLIYTFFLGVLIALFIGVGISTFYPTPKAPENPVELTYYKEPNEQQQEEIRQYDQQMQTFEQDKMRPYSRNVSIIALVGAVLLLASSILLEKKVKLIADGIMLGGLFTLFYSIGRGFAANDDKYSFVIITVSLGLVIYLGYHRFIKREPVEKLNKKA